jgi:hypothetical protein
VNRFACAYIVCLLWQLYDWPYTLTIMTSHSIVMVLQVPNSKETNDKIDALLSKLRAVLASGAADGQIGTVDADNTVLDVFSQNSVVDMLKIVNPDIKRMEAMRCARSLGPSLASEVENVRNKLRAANHASEEALEYMEKWSRRERDALDYGETMRQQEQVLLCTPSPLQCAS